MQSSWQSYLRSVLALIMGAALLLPLVSVWIFGRNQPAEATPSLTFPSETLFATLALAAAAALLAVVLGWCLAALFTLSDFPATTLCGTLLLVPLVCPPTVWALAQVYCYGPGGQVDRWLGGRWGALTAGLNPGSYTATLLTLAAIHAPLAMLIVGRGLRRAQRSGWEAARLYLGPPRLLLWLLRATRGEGAISLMLVFALSAGNFAVPHVMQCRTMPIEIYLRMSNYLDHAGALAWAAPLVGVTLGATIVAGWLGCRSRPSLPRSASDPPVRLGKAAWLWGALLAAYAALSTLLPWGAMAARCGSAGSFVAALRAAAPETETTLATAAAAALVTCVAGLAIARLGARWYRSLLAGLALLPLALPPLVLGLAYATFFHQPHSAALAAVGDSAGLLVLGLAARSWPLGTWVLVVAYDRLTPAWGEAARLAALSAPSGWWRITLPLLAADLGAAALIGYVLALGEVEISQLLCRPGQGTLALRLFTFLHTGPVREAASLSLLLCLLALLPVAVYLLLAARRREMV
jgi:iron(III) transport system permease protein